MDRQSKSPLFDFGRLWQPLAGLLKSAEGCRKLSAKIFIDFEENSV
jgi:hypothetical protein